MATISYTSKSVTLDPVSRVEGHLKVEVTVDTVNGTQQVVDARASGTMFRGIEKILVNRNPLDAPDITQRICGVCPVSHAMASTNALEAAGNSTIPDNARIMRNLVLGANFLQSHILHFYVLALLDFVDGPAMPPWSPSWATDKRIGGTPVADNLAAHYTTALDFRRRCHEMGALLGGRLPHPVSFVAGGFTTTPRPDRITLFKQYLSEITTFIKDVYIPDVSSVAQTYTDYSEIGGGYGNLLAYGVFDLDAAGNNKLLRRGRVANGATGVETVDTGAITENVTYSWYSDQANNLNPAAGDTIPLDPATKPDAYTWLKAPRYAASATRTRRASRRGSTSGPVPYEVGPLARMWVSGDYRKGISVMDRHLARAYEALKIATAMSTWIDQINPAGPVYQQYTVPSSGTGIGLTEAARGALGHWVNISGGRTARYQIVTPTCWNASPKDQNGLRGPIEQALMGTPVINTNEPVEVVRVIHSFDPCLSCAVHVMRPAEGARIFALGHVPC